MSRWSYVIAAGTRLWLAGDTLATRTEGLTKSSLVHAFRVALAVVVCLIVRPSLAAEPVAGRAPTNPLWHEQKIRNYLPDMTWPEVRDLLTRSDMVIVPVGALEEHGPQGPIGTDFYNWTEEALWPHKR
jgi:Creatinine amidohydrolase